MKDNRLLGYLLFLIWVTVTVYVGVVGWDYYRLPLIDRPLNAEHKIMKPGGFWGHGLGVIGASLIIGGVVMYMLRKRVRWMRAWGNLRVWLTVHIFLCVMGATLVTFHTAFKVGGLVAVSFWCMIGVVVSGGLGRYVYVRIPRDIRGQTITAGHLQSDYNAICETFIAQLGQEHKAVGLLMDTPTTKTENLFSLFKRDMSRFLSMHRLRRLLQEDTGLSGQDIRPLMQLAKRQAGLQRSIHFYKTLQNVLHYWHVIHLPFTVVMFLVMFVHVGVAILFGHRWTF